MPKLDIEVTADLQKALDLPPCADLDLPKPSSPLEISLPTGGSIKAFSDISKGIPNDCSMTLSLLVQIAPLLASMECVLKVLGLLAPLIKIVKGLPFPPVQAVSEFIEAAKKLQPCLNIVLGPASLFPFIRDLLLLIAKVLKCLIGQMKTVLGVMGGLALQLKAAEDSGNEELIAAIACAQKNAQTSAQHLTQSMEPIKGLVDLSATVMDLAGLPPLTFPQLGSDTDIESLQSAVETLEGTVETIESIAESLK